MRTAAVNPSQRCRNAIRKSSLELINLFWISVDTMFGLLDNR